MDSAATLTFCRWAIGLTFAVSALGKARTLGTFRAAVAGFGVLPRRAERPAAVGTVAAEALVVALVALGGGWTAAGFVLALVLLVVFSAVLASALRRKAEVACNCFGASERQVSWYDLARNGCLATCCAGGLASWAASIGGRPELALTVALSLMAATFVALVSNLADIVELLRRPYVVE